MKLILNSLFLISILFFTAKISAADKKDPKDQEYHFAYLVVLASEKDYSRSLETARSFSKKTGVPYDNEGMVFDKKRGLIYPDDYQSDGEFEVFRGQYFRREGNVHKNYISIEYTSYYPGLDKKEAFIIVGGVWDSIKNAEKMLTLYKRSAPKAFIHKIKIMDGCYL